MRHHDHNTPPGTIIADHLADQNLPHFGFVLIRTTYASQARWDAFLAKAKSYASDHFDEMNLPHVYQRMKWTVLEDPSTLDGADLLQTSRVFRAWVSPEGEGRAEMTGSVFEEDIEAGKQWVYCPRYTFFGRVDEESLESVLGDVTGARGCFCKIVCADAVFAREEEGEGEGEEEEEEEDEGHEEEDEDRADLEKRVKLYQLVELYALLAQVDEWYNIWMDPVKDVAMF